MADIFIDVGGTRVSASLHGQGAHVVALAHGAGGTRTTPLLVRLAETLGATGRRVLLYNFPYAESGAGLRGAGAPREEAAPEVNSGAAKPRRRVPDPPSRLEATVHAVTTFAREQLRAPRVVLGGKSLGGRIASQAVAAGTPAAGLLFLGYPLHPPGWPERLRDTHLAALHVPLLFVQGTRDAFARWDLLQALLARLGERATLHAIEDGDHSFAVPKRTGRTAEQVEAEIAAAAVTWLDAHSL